MKKQRNKFFGGIFCIVLIGILLSLNYILQPKWLTNDTNYDTTYIYYEQPDNTIEVIFAGTSVVLDGFSPLDLYENYGICSYNFGSSAQPMLATYYWLEEGYRNHSESLSTVILDVSSLRSEFWEEYYQLAALRMEMTGTKINLIKDCNDTLDDFMNFLSPIFSFHTRWKELEKLDLGFEDYSFSYARGYNYFNYSVQINKKYDEINVPNYFLAETKDVTEFLESPLLYLEKMVDFCEEEDIELILVKTPVNGWTDSDHIATQNIAEEYDLEFIDFNYSSYFDQLEYNYATDTIDGGHSNYYGATKLTNWIGEYLVENCNATDVRGLEEYAFMEGELAEYKRTIIEVKLEQITDPMEYISYVNEYDNYTLLISVKDEAAGTLTEEQRSGFKKIGLTELARLEYREAYIGVLEDEATIYEDTQEWLNREEAETESEEALYIEYEGVLPDGTEYILQSGGYEYGDVSSCVIDGIEYSLNQRGLNIVVYDNERSEVVDVANFDTCVESERISGNTEVALEKMLEDGMTVEQLTGVYKELYLYNLRCEDEYLVATVDSTIDDETGMYEYLNAFWDNENYVIFLSAQNDASAGLDEEARTAFGDLGLIELSELEYQDSYVAVIDGGNVLLDKREIDGTYIEEVLFEYEVKSGTSVNGEISFIVIDGEHYSVGADGINIAIYNKTTGLIVDTRNFNTGVYPVTIE